ncbi:hypothetical protein GBZ26_05160 [Azospirillum formosense]|uniref:Uncharacterized protein n=1 Tax=Azospirillum formosense TaxID=861533 RepID=A0ABX2KR49_9PROT|nr:hypothetical protein [Azospirillum formosense]MBY3753887.1 hypothetical protein [Azospirillum formosense]NUB18610.1 hypothetical protein [Azospirillum formosense]
MMVVEQFQAAREQTIDWLITSGLSAFEGYAIGQVLNRAWIKYNSRLLLDLHDEGERSWLAAQAEWLAKLGSLGGPISLLAAVRAID